MYMHPNLVQVDIGGHLPIPLVASPLSLSIFQFQNNLLFLAVFRVMNFRSRFEALNDVLWENREKHGSSFAVAHIKSGSPQIDISNEVLYTSKRSYAKVTSPGS